MAIKVVKKLAHCYHTIFWRNPINIIILFDVFFFQMFFLASFSPYFKQPSTLKLKATIISSNSPFQEYFPIAYLLPQTKAIKLQ